MPPRYSSVQKVADHLGLEFSGLQAAEAERSLLAAEAWLDARTGRTWAGVGPVTHLDTISDRGLYLSDAPVASVASVEVRAPSLSATWTALSLSSFELLDPAQGLLLLPWGYAGWWARVTYTPVVAAVDPRVVRATTLLAAAWLRPTIDATSGGGGAGPVISRSIGDVEVRYAVSGVAGTTTTASGAIPDPVLLLLGQLLDPVVA